MNEPKITINGVELTSAQSMTVRVAINSFLMDMINDGLGDDEHGKHMVKGYCLRCAEVNLLMLTAGQTGIKSSS